MDETLSNRPTPGHDLQGPHHDFQDRGERPIGFTPLRLVLQPGGLRIDVTSPDVVVGRHSQADIRLALPDISRRHCHLFFQDGHWTVSDLNSLNGVHVNEERIQEARIYEGDRLRLGGFTFLVEFPMPAAAVETEQQAEMLKSIVEALPPAEGDERKVA
jgi:pSer/pThr/pTyr-binding forkhead associated (FHA) protein